MPEALLKESVKDIVGQSLRRYMANLTRYFAAASISGLLAVFIPLFASAEVRPIMAGGLFCCAHGLYAAAASLAAQRWNRSLISLAFERMSGHSLTMMAFALGLFAASGLALLAGIIADARNNLPIFYATGIVMGGIGIFYLIRFWPVCITLFLYGGRHRWTPSHRGVFWDGPSFGTAWRMTGKDGALSRRNLPFLLVALVILTPNIVISRWLDELGGARFFGVVYFLWFAAPIITQLAYDFGETLVVPTEYDMATIADSARVKDGSTRTQADVLELDSKLAGDLYEKTGIMTAYIPPELLDPPQTEPSRWELAHSFFRSLMENDADGAGMYLSFIQDFNDPNNSQSALRMSSYDNNSKKAQDDLSREGQRHPGITIKLLATKQLSHGSFGLPLPQTIDAFNLVEGDYVVLSQAPSKRILERVVVRAVIAGQQSDAHALAAHALAAQQHFSLMGKVVFIGDSENGACKKLSKTFGEGVLSPWISEKKCKPDNMSQ